MITDHKTKTFNLQDGTKPKTAGIKTTLERSRDTLRPEDNKPARLYMSSIEWT